jgi:post-segregation antitoxin (ccd killing protein)
LQYTISELVEISISSNFNSETLRSALLEHYAIDRYPKTRTLKSSLHEALSKKLGANYKKRAEIAHFLNQAFRYLAKELSASVEQQRPLRGIENKISLTVRVDRELKEQAQARGVNLSRLLELALIELSQEQENGLVRRK